MHYKNGREAHNGDRVLLIPDYAGRPVVDFLYVTTYDPRPDLKHYPHWYDVQQLLRTTETDD